MKKINYIAFGFLALLAIIYIFASWITGNIIQNNLATQIDNFVNRINQFDDDNQYAVRYSNYQKGIFSSSLHLTVLSNVKNSENNQSINANNEMALFDDNITINHGPFPIAAIMAGEFMPKMLWINYLTTNQNLPKEWRSTDNNALLKSEIAISYSGALKTTFYNEHISTDTLPIAKQLICNTDFINLDNITNNDCHAVLGAGKTVIETKQNGNKLNIESIYPNLSFYKKETLALSIENLAINVNYNPDNKLNPFAIKIDKANFNNLTNNKMDIQLAQLQANGNIKQNPIFLMSKDNEVNSPKYLLNELNANAKLVKLSQNNMPLFKLEQGSLSVNATIPEPKHISFNLSLEAKNLLSNFPLGFLNETSLEHQNTKTAIQFTVNQNDNNRLFNIDIANSSQSIILGQQNLGTTKLNIHIDVDTDNNNQHSLLAKAEKIKKLNIEVNELDWQNSKGQLNLSSKIQLNNLDVNQLIFNPNNVDLFSLNVHAPLDVVSYLTAQFKNTHSATVTEKQFLDNRKKVEQYLAIMKFMLPFLKVKQQDTKGLFSDIYFEKGKDNDQITINGEKISWDDVIGILH